MKRCPNCLSELKGRIVYLKKRKVLLHICQCGWVYTLDRLTNVNHKRKVNQKLLL